MVTSITAAWANTALARLSADLTKDHAVKKRYRYPVLVIGGGGFLHRSSPKTVAEHELVVYLLKGTLPIDVFRAVFETERGIKDDLIEMVRLLASGEDTNHNRELGVRCIGRILDAINDARTDREFT